MFFLFVYFFWLINRRRIRSRFIVKQDFANKEFASVICIAADAPKFFRGSLPISSPIRDRREDAHIHPACCAPVVPALSNPLSLTLEMDEESPEKEQYGMPLSYRSTRRETISLLTFVSCLTCLHSYNLPFHLFDCSSWPGLLLNTHNLTLFALADNLVIVWSCC